MSKVKLKQKNKTTKEVGQVPFATAFLGKELDYLVENLSMLASSGMNIIDALSSISAEFKSKRMKKISASISEQVEAGSPLWRAMDSVNIFKPNVISLIRIGEESGRLSENLKIVSEQEEKNRIFKSKITSAMMYPVIVLIIMGVVGIGIAWFILPRLATVFDQLKLDLPALTKALIYVGEFLSEYGSIAIPAFVVGFTLILLFVFSFPKTKFIGQWILFHTPGIKKLIQEIELARMGYLFGTLISAGVPIPNSIESLARSADFPNYRRFYEYLALQVKDGSSFKKSFDSYESINKLIPHPIQQMIITGERSGNLSEMFLKIGSTYETRIESTTKNLSVILEPILLLFVWVGVVMVALAVVLPIYSLVGGLNTNPEPNEVSIEDAPIDSTVQEVLSLEDVISATKIEDALHERGLLRVLSTGIGYLNVREDSTTESPIVGRVIPGDELEYIDITDDGYWYDILLPDGESGWVYSDYIEEIEADYAESE